MVLYELYFKEFLFFDEIDILLYQKIFFQDIYVNNIKLENIYSNPTKYPFLKQYENVINWKWGKG